MQKRVSSIILAIVLFVSTTVPCFAAGVAPFWTNVSNATLVITFSGGQAECSGTITGKSGTTSIKATYTVERHDSSGYTYIGSWTANSSSLIINTSHSYAATPGKSYRIKVSATVTNSSGVSETINLTSTDYTY